MKPPIIPLPILNGQAPIFLLGGDPGPSIELAYERAPLVGDLQRSCVDYWIPRCTPVFAVRGGTVIYTREERDGHAILIDHGRDWITSYSRLVHPFARVRSRVETGDVIGYLGTPRGVPFIPLHFELWQWKYNKYEAVDPKPHARHWRYFPWRDSQLAREANDARARARSFSSNRVGDSKLAL